MSLVRLSTVTKLQPTSLEKPAPGLPAPRSTGARVLLLVSGWLAMGLGLAGAFLPLLPTTPFLILASACFLRCSPRLHQRLLAHPRLGPYLSQWQRDRSVPLGAKRRAYFLVVFSFGVSILMVDIFAVRILLAGIGTVLFAFLTRLRESESYSE